jgi:hypothetical protein
VTVSARTLRPTAAGWVYVLAVAALATVGFTTESTAGILAAAALALPSSIVAVPAYYVVYGLVALVPGANPSSSSGSASCTPSGDCRISTTGDAAAWFIATTEFVGILALTIAALANVVLLRLLIGSRREPTPTRTG